MSYYTHYIEVELGGSHRCDHLKSHLVELHDIYKSVVIAGQDGHDIFLVTTDHCQMCLILNKQNMHVYTVNSHVYNVYTSTTTQEQSRIHVQ